jgi:uncharacterized membrane protein YfcA
MPTSTSQRTLLAPDGRRYRRRDVDSLYSAASRLVRPGLSRRFGVWIAYGFATVVVNAAGPVMSMYLLSRQLTKEQFVATGAWFFFVVNLAKVPVYIWYGLFSKESLAFDAAMAPIVVAGGFAGLWLIHRVPQRVFEWLVVALTTVSLIFLFR